MYNHISNPQIPELDLDVEVPPFGGQFGMGDLFTDHSVASGDLIIPLSRAFAPANNGYGSGGVVEFFQGLFKKPAAAAAEVKAAENAKLSIGLLPNTAILKFYDPKNLVSVDLPISDRGFSPSVFRGILDLINVVGPVATYVVSKSNTAAAPDLLFTVTPTVGGFGAADYGTFPMIMLSFGSSALNSVTAAKFQVSFRYTAADGTVISTGTSSWMLANGQTAGELWFTPYTVIKGSPYPIKGAYGKLQTNRLEVAVSGLQPGTSVTLTLPGPDNETLDSIRRSL